MQILDSEILKQKIDDIAEYDLVNNNVFGSSYFVYQKGNVIYKNHYGVTGNGDSVSDKSLFRLASMTKPVTAVAMLILEEKGLISLSDPVSKYIPGFKHIHIKSGDGKDLGEVKNEPTILSMLCHASGFGVRALELTTEERATIQNTISRFIDDGLMFEPFAREAYSPYGVFDVLAAIAEIVSGIGYDEFLQREIFEPCGMKDTVFKPTEEQWQRVVKMHNKVDGKNVIADVVSGCAFENFPCEHKLAGAGLISSLEDYALFAKMLLNKGKTEKGRIMSEESAEKMSKPYIKKGIITESWGLGVRVITKESYEVLPVGTFGWSGAHGSHFWVDPENNIVAVFMKNSRFDGGSDNESARRFEKAVHESLK